MKKIGRPNARWDIDEEVKDKGSWVHMIDWVDIVPKICLSTDYPKGTQTTSRSICYAQHLNVIADQIQGANKSRFKTISEVMRLALHIGIAVLYKILFHDKGLSEGSRAKFFFDAMNDIDLLMESGQIVALIQEKHRSVLEMTRRGLISDEEARDAVRRAYESVPNVHKHRVDAVFNLSGSLDEGTKRGVRQMVGIPENE